MMMSLMLMITVAGAASATRAGPSSRIYPAQSEPDLTSIASSSDSGRRGPHAGPPATPRAGGHRIGQQPAPMTQPVNRTKPRTKSPPPVKPVSYRVFMCDTGHIGVAWTSEYFLPIFERTVH